MFENNQYAAQSGSRFETTFFGQVMMFFALAILVSAAGTYTSMAYFMEYFVRSPGLMYLVFIVELGLILTNRLWSQTKPLNYILFSAFAFISGVTLAPLLAVVLAQAGGGALIAKALLATGLMFTATAVIGVTTKKELSGLGGWLIMAVIGMLITQVIGMFIPWGSDFEMLFSGLGIVVFSAFTMYDFQKIKNGAYANPMDAALNLYLDIFNLFIYILRFMSNERN